MSWYRFTGEAGDRMPTQCVPRRHCGTHAPGWLQGSHPLVGEGVVKRTVCFSWRWDCCFWKQEVSVRNCGGFYVYRLQPPPVCRLRYCGNGKQNVSRCWPKYLLRGFYSMKSLNDVDVHASSPSDRKKGRFIPSKVKA